MDNRSRRNGQGDVDGGTRALLSLDQRLFNRRVRGANRRSDNLPGIVRLQRCTGRVGADGPLASSADTLLEETGLSAWDYHVSTEVVRGSRGRRKTPCHRRNSHPFLGYQLSAPGYPNLKLTKRLCQWRNYR